MITNANVNNRGRFRGLLTSKDISIAMLTIVLMIIFSIINKTFVSKQNVAIILKILPELGLMAIGMTMLIISGEFDLSVGSTFALAPYIMAILTEKAGAIYILAFIVCIITGTGIGFLNGIITTKIGIPSFIATLGTMMAWRGAMLLISGGFPQTFPRDVRIAKFFAGDISGFPIQFIWFIGFAAILWVILEHHKFGNWTYVTGGNREAATALGVPVDVVKTVNFMILGALSAFAGSIQVFRMGSAYSVAGTGMELQAIGATVIGGTLLSGGSGTVIGTVMGTIIIYTVENILILSRAPAFWFRTFIGVIIIIAVTAHIMIRGRRR